MDSILVDKQFLDPVTLVRELPHARPKTDEQLRKTAIADLQQERHGMLEMLVQLNARSEKELPGLNRAIRFIETELENVNRHLRMRQDGDAREGEEARRKDQPAAEYESGVMLKPKQSVRSYLQDHGLIRQHDFADLRMGALIRAMVTGPRNELERRALAEGSDSTGGVSVPDITLSRFIDALRAATVSIRAGAMTVPLTSDRTTVARTASDPVAAWRAEAGPVAVSDPTFDGVVLVPRSLAVMFKASRELLEDSVNIETAVEAAIRGALSVELDRVALRGSGTPPEPRGIANTVNVNTLLSAPIADWDFLIKGMAECWIDDSPTISAAVMSPYNFSLTAMLKEQTTSAPLRKPEAIQDIPLMMTSSMDDDTAIVGDFSKLIIGIRTELRIEILRELFAENLQVAFLAHLRADIGVEHPESFCVISNLTVS